MLSSKPITTLPKLSLFFICSNF